MKLSYLMTLCELASETILWEMCNKKQKTTDSLSGFNMYVYEYRIFNNNKKSFEHNFILQ